MCPVVDKMSVEPLTMNFPQTKQKDRTVETELVRDLDLLNRIAAKDEAALKELYAIHGQRLYAYALRLTGDPEQAQDVVQDVLVTAWHTAAAYRGEGRPAAWLLGIAHNIALKAQRRRSILLSEEMENTLPDVEALPDEQVQIRQQNVWVREGLQQLSPEHRAVLELVFYHGLSLEETARVCGCPLGTVKSRLSYARQHLRGLLSRTEEIR